ncbi:YcxB family protein [Anoxybacteroides amylolyticum]|uniref:YcxB-like family protein n=1 Tax=Anoxybacteroides amylolyticum TaxID=294699 RepID=A0A160F717_9BACL|nr:YcxB family protein [Anoxybacillus amylolyticus]ANB62081.1 ycxB-like family protein [Anoxybacillus amylolyticus]
MVGLYALVASGWHSALFVTFLPAISLIGLVISIVLQSKKENHVYREPKIYSISEEGVYVESSSSQHQYAWTAIKGIKKIKGYYYLFLGRNEAHVILEKSFSDRFLLEQFHSLISSSPKPKKRKTFPKIIFFTLVTLIIIGILSNMFSR